MAFDPAKSTPGVEDRATAATWAKIAAAVGADPKDVNAIVLAVLTLAGIDPRGVVPMTPPDGGEAVIIESARRAGVHLSKTEARNFVELRAQGHRGPIDWVKFNTARAGSRAAAALRAKRSAR